MKRFLSIIVLLVVLFGSISVVSAASDSTPPQLISYDFTPKTVDVSQSAQIVTFTLHVTDDISGLFYGQVDLKPPTGSPIWTTFWGDSSRVSGDTLNGVYQASIEIPLHSQAGEWQISEIRLADKTQTNEIYYYTQDLANLGFPHSMTVVSATSDSTPPQLISYDFTPKTVDVSQSAQIVTFTLHVTDDISGLFYGQVDLKPPTGSPIWTTFWGDSSRVSGDTLNGVYQASIEIPLHSQAGEWQISEIRLADKTQTNEIYYYTQDLANLGFPINLAVSGSVTPPSLSSITVSPASLANLVVGSTQQFTAIGHYSDNTTANITPLVTWTSSDSSKVSINASTGLAIAVDIASSPVIITATSETVQGAATVTVKAPAAILTSISVTPANPAVVKGSTQQFTASPTYSDGSHTPTPAITWSNSDGSKVSINASTGLAIAVDITNSPVTITATSGTIQGIATMTVKAAVPILTSISVTPANSAVNKGSKQQFTATPTYSDGSHTPTLAITWSSSDSSKVSIDASTGLATALDITSSPMIITAACGPVQGTANISVTNAGTSRSNPAGFGVSLTIAVNSVGSTGTSGNDYVVRLTTSEVLRGDQAWQLIHAANMFNPAPKTGYEYVLAKLRFEYLNGPTNDTAFDVSDVWFSAVSSAGVEYDFVSIVEPDPSIDTSLYPGGFHEGWLAVQVAQNDSNPLLTFGRKYDGTGGTWFKLLPGSVILPPSNITPVPPPNPLPGIGYGRSNPADFGISLNIAVNSVGSTGTSGNDYVVRLTTSEMLRGDPAWQLIHAANMFNPSPKSGYEYVLAKSRFEYLNGPTNDTAFDVSSVWFNAISSGGVEYEFVSIVEPDPSIDTSLYPGGFHEGWLAVQVAQNDSNPLLTFGRKYDGTGGIWFKLSKSGSSTTLTCASNQSEYGKSITFTATVNAVGPATGIPGGTVTFQDGSQILGTGMLNASGQATYNTSTLSVGSHGISAVYGGDANFVSSTSEILSIIVSPAAGTQIRVETAADGSGNVVAAQNVSAGNSLTVFSITRDQYGNFVANSAGTWSLLNTTGGVANSDLVPAGDNKSAVFNSHLIGAAKIHVASTGLTSTDSGTLTIVSGGVSKLKVSGYISPATAGSSNSFTLTAQDAGGNIATGYIWTVHFTSSDGQAVLPANYAFVSANNGTHNFTATLKTAGSQSIIATDVGTSSITGSQSGIIVNPAVATQIRVETTVNGSGNVVAAQNVSAGNSLTVFSITRDQYGNFVANSAGTWSLLNTTGGVANSDLVPAGDNKSAVFNSHLIGAAKIHVASTGLTSTDSGTLTIVSGGVSKLKVSGYISAATAGSSNSFTLTAQDAGGNIVTGYIGTVHFTSSDGQAVLPANYAFVSANNGTHNFTATLKTAGSQSIIATDVGTSSITGSQSGIIVNPAVATQIRVETTVNGSGNVVAAQNVSAGNSLTVFSITRDQYGNFVANSAGTWSLLNTTGGVANSDLVPAGDNKSAVFNSHLIGAAKIHVASTGLTSTDSGLLTVTPILRITGYLTPMTAGSSNSFTLTAQDAGGNIVTGYIGTVHFTSSDGQAVLPANYAFVSANNGTHNFTATLKTAGSQSIIATDVGTSSITGSQSAIVVNPADKSKLVWSIQPTVATTAGAIWPGIAIKIVDQYDNQTSGNDTITIIPSSGALGGTLTQVAVVGLATFNDITRTLAGTLTLTATSGNLTATPTSNTITVKSAPASHVGVETAADGSGAVVAAQKLNIGSTLTVYGVTRDQYSNFVGNPSSTVWSLTNKTGGVSDSDLNTTTGYGVIMTGHQAGTGAIHAVITGLTSIDSGIITVATPSGGGGGGFGGGGGTSSATLLPKGFKQTATLTLSDSGVIQGATTLTTADGELGLNIADKTKLLNEAGNPLSQITVDKLASPPNPSSDSTILMAYSFGPDGAKFDPALMLKMSYDPASLPTNVNEQDLYVGFRSGVGWEAVKSDVDTQGHIVSAQVSHFSTYALMGKITEPTAPSPTPTPTPTASPTSEPSPTPTPTPTDTLEPPPSLTPASIATTTSPPTSALAQETPTSFVSVSTTENAEQSGGKFPMIPVILGIIGIVLVLALIIIFIRARKPRP